jgi:dTDP-4-amino-4,6-dideoxygalactose transaminase
MIPISKSTSSLALQGGEPVCKTTWPTWPVFDDAERGLLNETLNSGQWWFGDKVKQFEAEFAAFQGSAFAVSCTNGTTAIEMGLRGIGIKEGDEVIVPPYSFIATASAVVTIGAIPVFADILPDTLCLDPQDVERKITPRTKAIIPVHVAGGMADMDQFAQIAQRNGLQLLEDAAHAWGSQWNGRGAGTIGRCGTFSFQATKNITAGEGGIMVTQDEALADMCRSFTHCGRRKGSAWYDHDYLGSNLRLTEFQAAVLLGQMTRLQSQTLKRQANARQLGQLLSGLKGIQLPAAVPKMTRRSFHLYIMRLDEAALGVSRDRFVDALNAEGVPASKGWYRPLYANGVFQRAHIGPEHGITAPLAGKNVNYTEVKCPVCEQVCRDAVWLPQNVLLTDESGIREISDAIKKVVAHAPDLAR